MVGPKLLQSTNRLHLRRIVFLHFIAKSITTKHIPSRQGAGWSKIIIERKLNFPDLSLSLSQNFFCHRSLSLSQNIFCHPHFQGVKITISTFTIPAFPFLVNISLFRDHEHQVQDCQDGQDCEDCLDNQDNQDCSCADCQDQYNQDEDCQDHLCSSIPGSFCLSGHGSHQLLGHSHVLHLKTYSEIKVHRRPAA